MALFNRELAIPKYGLEHLEALTPDFPTIESAFKLFLHSTALYVDKKGRVSHLREGLRRPKLDPPYEGHVGTISDG